MLLSRAKPAIPAESPARQSAPDKTRAPTVLDFINRKDYVGAITLLEIQRAGGGFPIESMLWLAYAAFHVGDYQKAMRVYEPLTLDPKCDALIHLYLGCCYFFLGMYAQADAAAQKGPVCKLQNRLLFHVAHKLNDEQRLMGYHQNLQDIIEDQLCLASIHYLRNHYQEAVDIYKRILHSSKDYLAVNVYLAMCYYKLDFYDVSEELLMPYLQHFPDSVIAVNLKACNLFKLFNGKAAVTALKTFLDTHPHASHFANDILKHNMVVFQGGEGALATFTPLLDVIPEARLNLTIHHLKQEDPASAHALMHAVEPSNPQEYILKGIVNAVIGQDQESREHLTLAQQYFQLVGSSASECDTIPGRQCMTSCFFLLHQFEEALVYLNSIKAYLSNDDSFNYNYGQALTATGHYKEGEEALLSIKRERYKHEYPYITHLCKCFIMNGKPQLAWERLLKIDDSGESFIVAQLIANECFQMKQFLYSAKAFDVVEQLDNSLEFWEGKRAACMAVVQDFFTGKGTRSQVSEVLELLGNSPNPQAKVIVKVLKSYDL